MIPTPLDSALKHLTQGDIVAFPTETVYGMGADAENPRAVAEIFRLKGRPADIPLTIHLGSQADPNRYAHIDPHAQALIDTFWPGPLTLILPKTEHVPDIVVAGGPTVGLRMPSHPLCMEFLNRFGRGVAAPSANKHQNISPTTAEHVRQEFGDELSCILDGGPCTIGLESTVLSLAHGTPKVFRLGAISVERLKECIGTAVVPPKETGKKYRQDQSIQVLSRQEWQRQALHLDKITVVSTGPKPAGVQWIQMPTDPSAYQVRLYAVLRELRETKAIRIIIEPVPDDPEWKAIANRLDRLT